MPKVTLNKEPPPPIDWLLAAMLERRTKKGISMKYLAERVGVSYGTMRKWSFRSPWEWPKWMREAACKELGITITETPTESGVEVKVR